MSNHTLAELGQAVLEEHRTAILAEQALQDPQAQQTAADAATHTQELLQELLNAG